MTWRGGRGAKAVLIALEIAGALLALAAGLAVLLFWRLQSGPVSLALFTRSAEFAVERALPADHRVRIAEATLARGGARGDYQLSLDGIRIDGPDGARLADLSNVTLTYAVDDLVHGQFGPRNILMVDPTLRIVRGGDRRFALDYAEDRPPHPQTNVFELLTGGPVFRGAFESAELLGARVYFQDVASARVWKADAAVARITRRNGGYSAQLEGVFDIEGEPAWLKLDAAYLETTGLITAAVDVREAPVGDLIEMFYGAGDLSLAAPLTGSASIILTRSGDVVSSRLAGHVGRGALRVAGHETQVESVDVIANFDPRRNQFDIERFIFDIGGSSGAFSGDLRIGFDGDALSPALIEITAKGRDIVVAAAELLPEPLPVSRLDAAIVYDARSRRLSASSFSADLLEVTLEGGLSLTLGAVQNAPAMTAEIAVLGALDPQRVLKAWPYDLADGARDFVETRLPRARIDNVRFSLDLPADARQPGQPMPDEAMRLTFDIAEATAIYAETMTPLTRAGGSAVLTGNRFHVTGMRGRVGDVALSEGEIDFTALSPRGRPVYYRFTAAGSARAMISVLDQPPLEVLKSADMEPQRFIDGEARARVEIMRPNLREVPQSDYAYSGRATFNNLSIAEFYRGIDITSATGDIELTTQSMVVNGEAALGGAPVNIEWRQQFYAPRDRSDFKVSGVIDSTTGDIFGVATRQYLRGPVTFTAAAKGDLGSLSSLRVDADFTRASLNIDALEWTKPEGEPTRGDIDVAFVGETLDVRTISLVGESVSLSGGATFDVTGLLHAANFGQLRFKDSADLTLALSRTRGGSLDVVLTGEYLNAGPMLRALVEAGGLAPDENDRTQPLSLRARIDSLEMRGGAMFSDASLDFARSADAIQGFSLSARAQSGALLSAVLKETGADAGPRLAVEARTDDIGVLLSGLFDVSSIQRGQGSMEIMLGSKDSEGLTGRLAARNMRVIGAPLLARVFAAGSLTGLADLLNGEGIELSQAVADFRFAEGVITLQNARATGPSVGITVEGSIAAGDGGPVDLRGAVAPAYQVNSFLGNTPLIGDLFVNRPGEGVVALSYDVHGRSDAPLVTVNPLSALTPGVLRRIFESPPREREER